MVVEISGIQRNPIISLFTTLGSSIKPCHIDVAFIQKKFAGIHIRLCFSQASRFAVTSGRSRSAIPSDILGWFDHCGYSGSFL